MITNGAFNTKQYQNYINIVFFFSLGSCNIKTVIHSPARVTKYTQKWKSKLEKQGKTCNPAGASPPTGQDVVESGVAAV